MDLFIGLDLGTSAVKVGLFDEAGQLLCLVRRGYRPYAPHPGWAEQEPVEWWEATRAALREVLTGADADQIAAVGLSGQTPGHVLIAADGRSLGRAIVWSDRRAVAEAAWLAEHVTPQQARAWTGYPFITGATQPPARLLWLKKHRPDDWNRCTAIVQPKDFIALQLTGCIATDVNSGFCLLHPETEHYHADYLALLGVEPEKMPPALSPTDAVGPVTPGAAALTGLPVGTPVVIGTIDAWCDIVGCGGVEPGCAVDVAGTSEVVALVTDRPVEGDGVFSSPLVGGRHWIGGPMQMGGAALEWLARGFYGGESDFVQMEAEASAVAPGAEGLLFLLYLRGGASAGLGQRRPGSPRRADRPSHPCSLRPRRLRRGGLCCEGRTGALPNRRRNASRGTARLWRGCALCLLEPDQGRRHRAACAADGRLRRGLSGRGDPGSRRHRRLRRIERRGRCHDASSGHVRAASRSHYHL